MLKKGLTIALIILSVLLMALPSVAMTFAPGPDERITEYYSHFSLMPIGYGNWLSLLAALSSLAALVCYIIDGVSLGGAPKAIFAVPVCLAVCLIASALSWFLYQSIAILSIFAAILQASAFVLQIVGKRRM